MREVGRVPLPVPLGPDLPQRHARELQRVLLQDFRRRRRRDRVVEDLVKGPQAALARDPEGAALLREDHEVVDARGDRVLGEELPRRRRVDEPGGGLGDRHHVSDGLDFLEEGRLLRRQLHELLGGLQRGRDDEPVKGLRGNDDRSCGGV